MRAVAFTQIGEPEVLRVMDVPDPVVGPGQVRIRVTVSGVNFRDVGCVGMAGTKAVGCRNRWSPASKRRVWWNRWGLG
jgi:NADPH:quinone reductase-like Zn-dependent oxidoreductase